MEKDIVLSKIKGGLKKDGLAGDFVAPGMHLLIDFWGCANMQDEHGIGQALRRAAADAGATVLDVHLHSFGEQSGITGVATLAESHISIHTWPEIDYVALDVFVCGSCNAYKALDALVDYFQPARQQLTAHERGVPNAAEARAIA